ncbi:MAG: aminomethyl-transferring glycine dehydrogenase subunit GcvPA [Pseudomonadota bacterium]
MSYIPHTTHEIEQMLEEIGVSSTEDLFDEIPNSLRCDHFNLGAGLNEYQVLRLCGERAKPQQNKLNFIGAGAYEHSIPAAVWDVVGRGEWMTAYTPYQAEASQGTLQLIFEFQTMITQLTGMEVANASLYDGATALAEAVLMAVRSSKQGKRRILIPKSVHPHYREVVRVMTQWQGITLEDIDWDPITGQITNDLKAAPEDALALVLPFPNAFGVLEEVHQWVDWAHDQNLMVIAVVNPMALALFEAPGHWGKTGADIVVGEGQPMGCPLSGGGPYFGFMCTRKSLVRHLPGRIVGRSHDLEGKVAYTLTLQAREQHIRRSKATSNICTNQGLAVSAATVFMSLLGNAGLREIAIASANNARALVAQLQPLGIKPRFTAPYFYEVALQIPSQSEKTAIELSHAVTAQGVHAGLCLETWSKELDDCWLTAVTETKSAEDINTYVRAVENIMHLDRDPQAAIPLSALASCVGITT